MNKNKHGCFLSLSFLAINQSPLQFYYHINQCIIIVNVKINLF